MNTLSSVDTYLVEFYSDTLGLELLASVDTNCVTFSRGTDDNGVGHVVKGFEYEILIQPQHLLGLHINTDYQGLALNLLPDIQTKLNQYEGVGKNPYRSMLNLVTKEIEDALTDNPQFEANLQDYIKSY